MSNFEITDRFVDRHIGPNAQEIKEMLALLGYDSLTDLMADTVPDVIRNLEALDLPDAESEYVLLDDLKTIAAENKVFRSFIGMGYHGTITPPVILRNVMENPGWYTQYTPYQAEISQGRLEALLNFQTMVMDLTGMEIANASLLDTGTAAAEAMTMFFAQSKRKGKDTFFLSNTCDPQTIAIVETRAAPLGIQIVSGDYKTFDFTENVFGALVQYPATDGFIDDYSDFCTRAHEAGAFVAVVADLLSLTLLKPPGEFGADVVVGSSQRFGVPMGYGGPHAAFFATKEAFKRRVPGRIIGVSVDREGKPALRMALQTREQHIRREKATSNICTAQVLLAVMAGFYAVYHGPDGLRNIATRIHNLTKVLAEGLKKLGCQVMSSDYFDTLLIHPRVGDDQEAVLERAWTQQMNFRPYEETGLIVTLDETTTLAEVMDILLIFGDGPPPFDVDDLAAGEPTGYRGLHRRTSSYLTHPVFEQYHSETEMLRYIHRLQARDLSLTTSMIPLGSCTMKLNATTQMMPVTWPAFGALHPFVPQEQAEGYWFIIRQLENWLTAITGFAATSLQPNSGAQGEYAGLLAIRAYHRDRGDMDRTVCLIPASAHGTNPASAVMAGMDVVVVACDEMGNIEVDDLRAKAEAHRAHLAALMVTYPSTHGVFEEAIRDICDIIHENGGLVYMDGANLNAQVGVCRPAEFGADVCHINLHKTFSIPHGGGGPGMGPICVAEHLVPYLPGHPVVPVGGEKALGTISAAPWGSASILLISWAYIALLGAEGVAKSTQVAILNANYMAQVLQDHFPILYRGANGRVAHEFILDLRPFRKTTGVTEEDVAKRLMDYGFHAPTMSFPVAGTIMVEPTESESKAELDRFCAALISIRAEIQEIEMGLADAEDNVLKNAPHPASVVTADTWDRPYARQKAAFPAPWTRAHKFWPAVSRVDNAHGDRNLICACPPIEDYAEPAET